MNWKNHAGLVFICLVFLACGILRLNDLSLYTPDSTRYVIWGNSLAQGQGFLDATQPDPDRYVIHAPFYAVLLAPVEFLFPMSLIAVKAWTLLWGVLAIVLVYVWLFRLLGKTASLAGALLFALNPLVLVYSSEALSEAPFIALGLWMFILFEKAVSTEQPNRTNMVYLLIAGAVVALVREVGVAMVLAVAVGFIVCRRRARAAGILAFTFGILALWYVRNHMAAAAQVGSQEGNISLIVRHFVTPADVSLMREFILRMWLNFKEYSDQVGGMLFYPLFASRQARMYADPSSLYRTLVLVLENGKIVVVLVSTFLMLSGMYADMRTSKTGIVRLCSVVLYLGVVLVYPVHDIRFLVPLLPLMIFYVIRGAQWHADNQLKMESFLRHQRLVVIALILMLPNCASVYEIVRTNVLYVKSPVRFYESFGKTPTCPSVFTQPWTLLGRWIRTNIPEGPTIATPAKEIAIVVGDRKVMELNPGLPLPLFERLLRDHCVDYVLAPVRWENIKTYEFLMNESKRFWFEPVYSVSNLFLFKVHSRFKEPSTASRSAMDLADTTTVGGLVSQGRADVMNGRYDEAVRLLTKGMLRAPEQTELVYQLVLASAQKGDVGNCVKYYQRLFTMPQVGFYLATAQFQTEAAEFLQRAESQTITIRRSLAMVDIAIKYWNFGYYQRACSVINAALDSDSTYFVGLLWGFDYSFQLGDSTRAFHYLGQLERIDPKNAVVLAFGRIRSAYDSLGSPLPAKEKSRQHLSIAEQYRIIELDEEALDEAEKAQGEDPTNTAALAFIAKTFEQRFLFRSAGRMYRQIIVFEPGNASVLAKIDSLEIRLSHQ